MCTDPIPLRPNELDGAVVLPDGGRSYVGDGRRRESSDGLKARLDTPSAK